jgi:hypothetical protein
MAGRCELRSSPLDADGRPKLPLVIHREVAVVFVHDANALVEVALAASLASIPNRLGFLCFAAIGCLLTAAFDAHLRRSPSGSSQRRASLEQQVKRRGRRWRGAQWCGRRLARRLWSAALR